MATLSATQRAAFQSGVDLLTKSTAVEFPLSEDVLQRVAPFITEVSASDIPDTGTIPITAANLNTGSVMAWGRDNPVSFLILLVAYAGRAVVDTKLTSAERLQLIDAVRLMTTAQAREIPFADDVIGRLTPVAVSSGFKNSGQFKEAIRDNPVSTMLNWALFLGS